MVCNRVLQNAGKPYPRTCSGCGLGPCTTRPWGDWREEPDLAAIEPTCGYRQVTNDLAVSELAKSIRAEHASNPGMWQVSAQTLVDMALLRLGLRPTDISDDAFKRVQT